MPSNHLIVVNICNSVSVPSKSTANARRSFNGTEVTTERTHQMNTKTGLLCAKRMNEWMNHLVVFRFFCSQIICSLYARYFVNSLRVCAILLVLYNHLIRCTSHDFVLSFCLLCRIRAEMLLNWDVLQQDPEIVPKRNGIRLCTRYTTQLMKEERRRKNIKRKISRPNHRLSD